jgi:Leucine-rich repeat (LRR) protein
MLNFNDNRLTGLDLTCLDKLEGIKCSNNYLENLVLSPLQTEQLTYLYAENNNFFSQNCSVFGKSVNLKELKIGNHDQTKINQEIYNRFTGSLEPLQNLGKLEYLDISNTDIDSGLEYLPESVKVFSCETYKRKKAKVKIIQEDWEYFNHDLKKYKDFISESDDNQKSLNQ